MNGKTISQRLDDLDKRIEIILLFLKEENPKPSPNISPDPSPNGPKTSPYTSPNDRSILTN